MWELCTIAEILLAGIWTKLDIEFTSNVHNVCTTLTLTGPSHCQPAPSVGIELLIFHFTAFNLVLNLDRHLLPRPALPTWSPCLFPSPLIPFTLLSEVFTGHEVKQTRFSLFPKRTQSVWSTPSPTLQCLQDAYIYTSPLWAVLCAWLLQLQEAWYMRNEKRNCTSQDKFFPS